MIVQVALAATVLAALHVPPVMANWDPVVSERLAIVAGESPEFVTVKVTGLDVEPTFGWENFPVPMESTAGLKPELFKLKVELTGPTPSV